MHRPIGVVILAAVALVAALYQVYRLLVFLGIASFTFVGKSISFTEPQWGYAIWALILAAIWFYIAEGFWNVRAYAWMFGVIIAIFELVFASLAVLGSSTLEAETVPLLVSLIVLLYLFYPGVQAAFAASEISRLDSAAPPATPAAPAPPSAPPPAAG